MSMRLFPVLCWVNDTLLCGSVFGISLWFKYRKKHPFCDMGIHKLTIVWMLPTSFPQEIFNFRSSNVEHTQVATRNCGYMGLFHSRLREGEKIVRKHYLYLGVYSTRALHPNCLLTLSSADYCWWKVYMRESIKFPSRPELYWISLHLSRILEYKHTFCRSTFL